jgi:hypothetical protein
MKIGDWINFLEYIVGSVVNVIKVRKTSLLDLGKV